MLLLITACSPPGLPFGGARPTPTLALATLELPTEAITATEAVEMELPTAPPLLMPTEEETPTALPSPSPTKTPEISPTAPSPAVTPTAPSIVTTPALSMPTGSVAPGLAIYTDQEHGFSLGYPPDWDSDSPRPGTVAFSPSGKSSVQGVGAFLGLDAVTWSGSTAKEVLDKYVAHMSSANPGVKITSPRQLVVGNVMGLGVDLQSVNETSGEVTRGFALGAVASGRGYVVVAAALEKDWPALSMVFTRMAESIQLVGGEAPVAPAITTGTPVTTTAKASPQPPVTLTPGAKETPVAKPVPPSAAIAMQVVNVSPGYLAVTLSNRSGQNWYLDDPNLNTGALTLEIIDRSTGLRIPRIVPVSPTGPATVLLPPGRSLTVKVKLAQTYAFAKADTYKIVVIYRSVSNTAGRQPFWPGVLTSAPTEVYVP